MERPAWDPAEYGSTESANGLRVGTLGELTSWCRDDWPDFEYWRSVAIAAAYDICGKPECTSSFTESLFHLRSRRYDHDGVYHDPASLFDVAEAADQIISDEINLFLNRIFAEELAMPTAAKRRSKPAGNVPQEIVDGIPDLPAPSSKKAVAVELGPKADEIPIDKIRPEHNPRKKFDEEALEQLAKSIKANGILQALAVRSPGPDGMYELIAGERRLRAAKLAGLKFVPVKISEMSDVQAAAARLEENLMREDLNAIEEALGYQDMLKRFKEQGITQKTLGEQLGKSQAHISNRLRLLNVPQAWQQRLIDGECTDHHLWQLVPFAGRDVLFQELEDDLKHNSQIPATGNFRQYVQNLVLRVTRPLKAQYYYDGKKQWEPFDLKPTAVQEEDLDVFEMKYDTRDKEKRCWNIAEWEKLLNAEKRRKSEKEAAKAEKAATAGKDDPQKQKKREAQFQEKLYLWKIRWLQSLIVETIPSLSEPVIFRLMFLFSINPSPGDRYSIYTHHSSATNWDGPSGHYAWEALTGSMMDCYKLGQTLIEEWFGGSVEGQCDTPPELIEAVAAFLDINQAKRWKLTEDYLQLHTSDQLRELATKEWKLRHESLNKLKRGELIEWLLETNRLSPLDLPSQVLKCNSESLKKVRGR